MKFRIKNTKITTSIISWIEIIGGIAGIGLLIRLLMRTQTINGPILLILLIGIFLSVFSIVSGRYLAAQKTVKLGLILSVINFFLQLVSFKIGGYAYEFTSGINLLVGFENALKFNFGIITSTFNMSINTDDPDFAIKINVIAIIIIWLLADIFDELFLKKAESIENIANEIESTAANPLE
ncbi:hypothetical protein [Carboxylicivirga linearis]|uniref:Uncharacterized protein n=1 Tax=Carboxylicivirga linearis TaxID=1628157 RepID=A0ABS5K227_9BACT|nr:hypothetical protein [Carboxylicivirga linearis]MBS2101222.1 hypothetical protein [Carboxylicivirga linearis]